MRPRIQRVVAEHLGVGVEELRPEVSLTDDLAADSLDLVELELALESEFGVPLPETALRDVRTYGELVGQVQRLVRRGAAVATAQASRDVPFVRVRILPGPGHSGGELQRAGGLTPYAAQTIADDVLRSGPGARLELTLPSSVSDGTLAHFLDEVGRHGGHDVEVHVERRA